MSKVARWAFWGGFWIIIGGILLKSVHHAGSRPLAIAGMLSISAGCFIIPFLGCYSSGLRKVKFFLFYYGLGMLFFPTKLGKIEIASDISATIIPISFLLISGILQLHLYLSGDLKRNYPKRFSNLEARMLPLTDPDKYSGTYYSGALDMQIKVWSDEGRLIAQSDEQPEFKLDWLGGDSFRQERIGLVIEFVSPGHNFILYQYGRRFTFKVAE